MRKSTINGKPPALNARDIDPLFAGLRHEEAVELCRQLAANHNGDVARIEAEFTGSTLYDPDSAQAAILAGVDAWLNG